jgi:hypothetical protein
MISVNILTKIFWQQKTLKILVSTGVNYLCTVFPPPSIPRKPLLLFTRSAASNRVLSYSPAMAFVFNAIFQL